MAYSYNIRLIRYSDVLLMYAGVLNENGKPDKALIYLNQIEGELVIRIPEIPDEKFKFIYHLQMKIRCRYNGYR